MTKERKTKSDKKLLKFRQAMKQAGRQRLSDWRSRPRLHTAIFEEAWRDDQFENEVRRLGAEISELKIYERARQIQKREIEEEIEGLGWTNERLKLFQQMVAEYRRGRSPANYLRIRQTFPEVEIQVGEVGGIDMLFTLKDDFKKLGIDPHRVAAALDGDEPSIDALCLHLMELLVARDALPKSGPGWMERRRQAIDHPTVNYLIMTMLEAFDWHGEDIRVPASLIVLIRHQFFAGVPNLHKEFLSRYDRQNTALAFSRTLKPGERVSINRLARTMNLPRSTAARWLSQADFRQWIEVGRRWAKDGVFEQGAIAYKKRLGLIA